MKIIRINLNEVDKTILAEIDNVLRAGGIVIHPTDTCYGIAADIRNVKAVRKVYEFKKRSVNKPLSIIVSKKEMFEEYGNWANLINDFLNENTEKMYSFVVKRTDRVPKNFNEGFNDIAIQLPKNSFSLEMLKKFSCPLTATSANISKMPSVYSVEELLRQITDELILPDLIIDAGELPFNKPSTIIKINNNGYEVLRS